MTLAFAVKLLAAAVTVGVFGEGKFVGPVYLPFPSIVPTVAFPPCTPFTLHVAVTAVPLPDSAENCWVAPRATVAEPGDTVRPGGGGGGGGGVEPPPPQEIRLKAKRQKTHVFNIAFIVQPRLSAEVVNKPSRYCSRWILRRGGTPDELPERHVPCF